MKPEAPKPFVIGENQGDRPAPEGETVDPGAAAEKNQPELRQAEAKQGGRRPERPAVEDVSRLGADLARALQEGGYHPVVLFGTNFSGKTSLLLSLFSTIVSEPQLRAGLMLCDPILGTKSGIGRQLHDEARHTFDVKTQAFIEGTKIPKTAVALPFFIPVELRPLEGPPIRFAFLESNGEWYRPNRDATRLNSATENLYPELRAELEDFIASFQGPITFLYLIPYTQGEVYDDRDVSVDANEVQSASLAITGVLRAYDRTRANHRGDDQHLMLVTKWDAHSAREADRAGGIEEDPEAVREFCARKYSQALATYQGLGLAPHQRRLNAYCSGIINERGLLQLRPDDDVRGAVMSYPVKLWDWLYRNGLSATGQPGQSPFPEPPRPPALLSLWNRLLEFVSGR